GGLKLGASQGGGTIPFGDLSAAGKLTSIGKSDAVLAAGIGLGIDGLRRGGVKGLFETAAGGAAIGFRFGGPIGAAIGAGIGAAVGTVRLFVKGPEEQVIDQ